jgi:hypothetical protein
MSELTQYTTDEINEGNLIDVMDDISSESFALVVKSNGLFSPDRLFTTINDEAMNRIKSEIEYTSEIIGVSVEELLESMPSLYELING